MISELLQNKFKMLKPEVQKRFIEEQFDTLDAINFEGEVSKEMPRFRQFVFMHENELSLNISFKYWRYCCFGKNETYNLNDISVFIIASEKRIFKEWIAIYGASNEETKSFIEFKLYVEELNSIVTPTIDKICEEIIERLLKVQHLEIITDNTKNSGNYKPNKNIKIGKK